MIGRAALAAKDIGLIQSSMLMKSGVFLYGRYIESCAINSAFVSTLHDDIVAYELKGKSAVVSYCNDYTFNSFRVSSIRSDYGRRCVHVEYDDNSSSIFSEKLFFDEEGSSIVCIKTDSSEKLNLGRRLQICGGPESEESVQSLKAVRLLKLGTTFLYHDVNRELDKQQDYLTDESRAFGAIGKKEIGELQRQGVEGGTQYTVPFPLLVNNDESCISLDFNAHTATSTVQRGTDIMYLDLRHDKILRIDTLRHTLTQPNWVKRHFS